jgi:hypothetical protein
LKKRYGIILAVMLSRIVVMAWDKGFSNDREVLQSMIVAGLGALLVVLIVGVPVEYHRLKRIAAGLYVSDSR